ncbi:unnamed protein product, partial [Eretmochelys imbricata]
MADCKHHHQPGSTHASPFSVKADFYLHLVGSLHFSSQPSSAGGSLDQPENLIMNGVLVVIQEDLDMLLGSDLCAEEQDFLQKRKKVVAATLKKVLQLEEDLLDHEV